MIQETVLRECAFCGMKFFPHTNNQKFCSTQCADKSYHGFTKPDLSERKCAACGKLFIPNIHHHTHQKFCSRDCSIAYHKRNKRAPCVETKEKSISDWVLEARQCNLDYGTYRALINLGKSFDELKAAASSCPIVAHSHHNHNSH